MNARARIGAGLLALCIISGGGLAACGDDDDGGGVEAYCNLSAELQGVEEPSDEQLDEIVSAAPEEIRDDAETLADAIRDGGEEAFQDEDVVNAATAIQEFDRENCGGDATDAT